MDNLTDHMRFALDKITANGRTIFYRWPGDRWTDVKPTATIREDLRARRSFVVPVWYVSGSVIRALERRALLRALGPDAGDPREIVSSSITG
jgi:hypothetical protein